MTTATTDATPVIYPFPYVVGVNTAADAVFHFFLERITVGDPKGSSANENIQPRAAQVVSDAIADRLTMFYRDEAYGHNEEIELEFIESGSGSCHFQLSDASPLGQFLAYCFRKATFTIIDIGGTYAVIEVPLTERTVQHKLVLRVSRDSVSIGGQIVWQRDTNSAS